MAEPATNLARTIRKEAARLGFSAIGFSSPAGQPLAMQRYREMITEKRHGEMEWMEQGVEQRSQPDLLLPDLKTIISAAISYNYPLNRSEGLPNISRYALIDDYHTLMRRRLEELLASVRTLVDGPLEAVIAVDSAPVMEKSWAELSGMGKIGKNSLLMVPSAGSYLFLGEILIDRKIADNKAPLPNLCGSCNNCMEQCPTGALLEPGKIDASRCISYLTVELKREFTTEEAAMIGDHLFGCDLCQDVCPHNRQATIKASEPFFLRERLLNLTTEQILSLTKSGFRDLFYGTPIFRIGLRRLKRNARAVEANLKKAELPTENKDSSPQPVVID